MERADGSAYLEDRVEALRDPNKQAKLIADGIAAGDMQNFAHMLHPFGVADTQIWTSIKES